MEKEEQNWVKLKLTVTGASTLWTLLSSTRISIALRQRAFTSDSLRGSHRLSCSICLSRSDMFAVCRNPPRSGLPSTLSNPYSSPSLTAPSRTSDDISGFPLSSLIYLPYHRLVVQLFSSSGNFPSLPPTPSPSLSTHFFFQKSLSLSFDWFGIWGFCDSRCCPLNIFAYIYIYIFTPSPFFFFFFWENSYFLFYFFIICGSCFSFSFGWWWWNYTFFFFFIFIIYIILIIKIN